MKQNGYSSSGPMRPAPRYNVGQARHQDVGVDETNPRPGQLGSNFKPKLAQARATALRSSKAGGNRLGGQSMQSAKEHRPVDTGLESPNDGLTPGPVTGGSKAHTAPTSRQGKAYGKQLGRSTKGRSRDFGSPADGSSGGDVWSR